ncbi:MAG: formyltransferase family protein [bacterium]|nr:formyltransferase family protein [bacterium]
MPDNNEKVRLGLVASGSGTDANAIMSACNSGNITNAESIVLISTKPGVGCLEKARRNQVEAVVVDKKALGSDRFRNELDRLFGIYDLELIFLVGCVVVFQPFVGFPMYNIHPADPKKHGGKKMYGLKVHEHVLLSIKDQIERGMKSISTDRFFTYPTVHEVIADPDQGQPLIQAMVQIPPVLIHDLMSDHYALSQLAERLQKHVLPYEWLLLPCAVEMAARRILEQR